MKNEILSLSNSYKQLFYKTGRIEFFMAYRKIEKNNQAILLNAEQKQSEQGLEITP